jgi:arylsulfatase A-like enzyme
LCAVRPNVLLIVLDTARADAFEPYGAPKGASPAVADLASRGVASPLAHSACSWTMPSHVAMFTGALPRSLGLGRAPGRKAANCRPVLEANADRVLAEVLRRAGYATAAVSANPWIGPYAGFGLGFERFTTVKTQRRRSIYNPRPLAHIGWALESLAAKVDDGAAKAKGVVRSWIGEGSPGPFFWFVNLMECHSPYLPPRPYNGLGPIQRLRASEEARRHLTINGIGRHCAGRFPIPDGALERMRRGYAAEIRLMDDWLADVLGELDRRGLLDETLVIVTSDHGENLGEGRLIGHALSLDQRLIHVPLVAAGPGASAFETLVSSTSLPRLVAEAVGLDDHGWPEDPLPPGVAVAQFDALVDPADPELSKTVVAWDLDHTGIRLLTSDLTVATDGRWKVLRYGDEEMVYDLTADPLELSPSSPNGADNGDVARLRAVLDRTSHSDRAPAPDLGLEAADAEELAERMRLLGYL